MQAALHEQGIFPHTFYYFAQQKKSLRSSHAIKNPTIMLISEEHKKIPGYPNCCQRQFSRCPERPAYVFMHFSRNYLRMINFFSTSCLCHYLFVLQQGNSSICIKACQEINIIQHNISLASNKRLCYNSLKSCISY